jgi:hypothetical protein
MGNPAGVRRKARIKRSRREAERLARKAAPKSEAKAAAQKTSK